MLPACPGSPMASTSQPTEAITTVTKEPSINSMAMPERMGKMISCLLAFKTLKLFMEIVHPLDKRSKKLIRGKFYYEYKYNTPGHKLLIRRWENVSRNLHQCFTRPGPL